MIVKHLRYTVENTCRTAHQHLQTVVATVNSHIFHFLVYLLSTLCWLNLLLHLFKSGFFPLPNWSWSWRLCGAMGKIEMNALMDCVLSYGEVVNVESNSGDFRRAETPLVVLIGLYEWVMVKTGHTWTADLIWMSWIFFFYNYYFIP